jgi:hypothetical protein
MGSFTPEILAYFTLKVRTVLPVTREINIYHRIEDYRRE